MSVSIEAEAPIMVKTTMPHVPGKGKGKEWRDAMARKTAWKRKLKKKESAINGITKPAIRRLARRGGVQRINGDVYDHARSALRSFLAPVIKDAIAYSECAQRKTVCLVDVLHSLKRNGRTLYHVFE